MIIIILILALFLQTANAAENQRLLESMHYPPRGVVLKFLVDKDSVIYIATPNGIFKSINNGDSWLQIFDEGFSEFMSFDSKNNLIINVDAFNNGYSYEVNAGYYSTSDKGKSWSYIEEDTLGIITIDTVRNDMYYKIDFHNYQQSNNIFRLHIYNSTNKGLEWGLINNEFNGSWEIRPSYFNMVNDSILLLEYNDDDKKSNDFYYFSVSMDYGKSWMKPKLLPGYVDEFYFINKGRVFIKGEHSLLQSTNLGDTWETVNSPFRTYFFKYQSNGSFYAGTLNGLYYSKDTSFQWIKISDEFFQGLEILPSNRFIGYSAGNIVISDDSGKTWRKSMKGFSASDTYAFFFSPWGEIFCTNYAETLQSKDKGATWDTLKFNNIGCIAYDKEGNMFVSSFFNYCTNLFKSTDRGKSWKKISIDSLFQGRIPSILFKRNGYIICYSYYSGVILSKDNGKTWGRQKKLPEAIRIFMNSEEHLFGGGREGLMERSTDDGETWETQHARDHYFSFESTDGFIFHPTNGLGYAYGLDFLCKTTDNGRTWDYRQPNRYDEKYYFNAGTVDSSGNIFFINYRYLYVHLNNEDTMRIFKHGLWREFADMETAPDGSVYVSILYGGLYRLRLDLIDGLSVEEVRPSPLFAFPNPAQEKVTIRYEASVLPSTLLVTDILGNKVAERSLPDATTGAGSYTLGIDGYSPGVYLYTVSSGSSVGRGKFVVK